MGENKPKVIVIPAAPKNTGTAEQRQLRVAAYCRVSTKEEDQLNSYEAQKNYYTDKIMENKSWTMADIFADEAHHRHFGQEAGGLHADDEMV